MRIDPQTIYDFKVIRGMAKELSVEFEQAIVSATLDKSLVSRVIGGDRLVDGTDALEWFRMWVRSG